MPFFHGTYIVVKYLLLTGVGSVPSLLHNLYVGFNPRECMWKCGKLDDAKVDGNLHSDLHTIHSVTGKSLFCYDTKCKMPSLSMMMPCCSMLC